MRKVSGTSSGVRRPSGFEARAEKRMTSSRKELPRTCNTIEMSWAGGGTFDQRVCPRDRLWPVQRFQGLERRTVQTPPDTVSGRDGSTGSNDRAETLRPSLSGPRCWCEATIRCLVCVSILVQGAPWKGTCTWINCGSFHVLTRSNCADSS